MEFIDKLVETELKCYFDETYEIIPINSLRVRVILKETRRMICELQFMDKDDNTSLYNRVAKYTNIRSKKNIGTLKEDLKTTYSCVEYEED